MRLQGQVAARQPLERAQWTLHKYRGFQRVVSDCALSLPVDNSALRQIVVRIKSRQSLVHYLEHGAASDKTVLAGSEHPKDLVEQLILQRRIFRGKEGPWRIWGTGA